MNSRGAVNAAEVSTTVSRKVSELRPDERQWLEHLTGRQIQEGQHLFIALFTPDVVPNESVRRAALADLQQVAQTAAANIDEQGGTPEEVEAAIEEAMQSTRRRED